MDEIPDCCLGTSPRSTWGRSQDPRSTWGRSQGRNLVYHQLATILVSNEAVWLLFRENRSYSYLGTGWAYLASRSTWRRPQGLNPVDLQLFLIFTLNEADWPSFHENGSNIYLSSVRWPPAPRSTLEMARRSESVGSKVGINFHAKLRYSAFV